MWISSVGSRSIVAVAAGILRREGSNVLAGWSLQVGGEGPEARIAVRTRAIVDILSDLEKADQGEC